MQGKSCIWVASVNHQSKRSCRNRDTTLTTYSVQFGKDWNHHCMKCWCIPNWNPFWSFTVKVMVVYLDVNNLAITRLTTGHHWVKGHRHDDLHFGLQLRDSYGGLTRLIGKRSEASSNRFCWLRKVFNQLQLRKRVATLEELQTSILRYFGNIQKGQS